MNTRSLSVLALTIALAAAPALAGSATAQNETPPPVERLPDSEQSGNGAMMDQPAQIGQSMMSMQAEMNRMFNEFFDHNDMPMMGFGPDMSMGAGGYPPVDIFEEPQDYKVTFELPGIDPQSVDLTVNNNFLTVKGQKKQEDDTKTENYVRHETSFGAFERSVNLPNAADIDRADAAYKNGVLTVTFPKKANAEPENRKLKIRNES